MSKETVRLMDERIEEILKEMESLDVDSEEFEQAAKNIKIIHEAKISEEKLMLDNEKFDGDFDKWKEEHELKKEEMDLQKKSAKNRIIEIAADVGKAVIAFGGSVVTIGLLGNLYDDQTNKFLTFEKEGNIPTSSLTQGHMRNISNLLPHGKK